MKIPAALRNLGPGFVIAATGLGAGDMVTAAVAGAQSGSVLLWAIALGALLKWLLNEGLARWQLVSGSSLLSGWHRHLPRWLMGYFFLYLLVWSFLVAAALMAACGLAAHALFPQLSITAWAALQSLLAAALVLMGRYSLFENAMKILVGMMFLGVMLATLMTDLSDIPIWQPLLIPSLPPQGVTMMLAVMGGVGGSVTLLCYGYWMREKGWRDSGALGLARSDLAIAYLLTALFAMGIMLLAAKSAPTEASGLGILLAMAKALGDTLGEGFQLLFLCGFWAAVFSSMLGVWQGVPYLYADTLRQRRSRGAGEDGAIDNRSAAYRGFLAYLALPPLVLLLFGKPVWLVLAYSIAGAFFMPFLALTLLYLNNRKISLPFRNGRASNAFLMLALLLFIGTGLLELW